MKPEIVAKLTELRTDPEIIEAVTSAVCPGWENLPEAGRRRALDRGRTIWQNTVDQINANYHRDGEP